MLFKIITNSTEKLISVKKFELNFAKKEKMIILKIKKNIYILDCLNQNLEKEWKKFSIYLSKCDSILSNQTPPQLILFNCNKFYEKTQKTNDLIQKIYKMHLKEIFSKEIMLLEKIIYNLIIQQHHMNYLLLF